MLGEPGTLAVREKPSVLLVVGVNGTGKTTTIGKLAYHLNEHGRSVIVAAADTFRRRRRATRDLGRPGAGELRGLRARRPSCCGLRRDRSRVGARPTSSSSTRPAACTRTNLMEELAKIRRVIENRLEGAPHETLLVVDATTGQWRPPSAALRRGGRGPAASR